MTMTPRRTAGPWCLVTLLVAMTATAAAVRPGFVQQSTNPDKALLADFHKRIQTYVDLRAKLNETLPTLNDTATPEDVEQHQHALERLIARARAGAKRGDIFTQPIRAHFRRQLARVFTGPEGKAARRSIMDENPRTTRIHVNSRYPNGVVLSTMPPQVLLLLPALPRQLEYRFVGEDLLLLDLQSAMVVDYIDEAIDE
jgi:hypothetical protein